MAQTLSALDTSLSKKLDNGFNAQLKGAETCARSDELIQEKLSKLFEQVERPMIRLTQFLNDLEDSPQEQRKEQERANILQWLSRIPNKKHHINTAHDILTGSGQWLLDHPAYTEWRTSSYSSILWLHGIPGCGKSKLVARVTAAFLDEKVHFPSSAPMSYFYCTRNPAEPERASPSKILRSVLKQLLATRSKDTLPRWIVDEYRERIDEAKADGSEAQPLTIDETVSAILRLAEESPITILIDALDEVDRAKRHDLLQGIHDIAQNAVNVVKVFVSSREDGDLVLRLKDVPNIYIKASDNEEDIRKFVDLSIDKAISQKRLLGGMVPKPVIARIKRYLVKGAQGMYVTSSLTL